MYDVRGVLPTDSLPPETLLLGASPPLRGGRALSYRFVARGLADGEAGIVVSTDESPDSIAAELESVTGERARFDRLGIIDCTGQTRHDRDRPYHLHEACSPADLTGIGVAFEDLLSEMPSGEQRLRIVVDSVSSLIVYSEFERVFRFLHVCSGWCRNLGAAGIFLVQPSTEDRHLSQLEQMVDGRLDIRGDDTGVEYRLAGLENARDGWLPLDASADGGGGAAPNGSPESAESVAIPDDGAAESLHAIIDRVTEGQLTITVCNFSGSDATLDALSSYFERLNVAVRTANLSTEVPEDVAVLHRGPEPVASCPVAEVRDAVRAEGFDDLDGEEFSRPKLVERAHRREYTVANEGKREMVRISRLIERRALDRGRGTLRAGFQQLDRLVDDRSTRRLYERIAATDAEVHLYGRPGDVPGEERYSVHCGEAEELETAWFVVFENDEGDETGALLSEEVAPGRYSGFWTYRGPIVTAIDAYLESTYG